MQSAPSTKLRAFVSSYRLDVDTIPKWVDLDTTVVRVEFDSVGWNDVAIVHLADGAVVRVAVDSRTRKTVRVTAKRPKRRAR